MNEIGSNPFPGLRPFEEDESHLFFGRGKQVMQLVERLRQTRFLAVVGASGCGKSSLIRAGLLPSLQAKENSPLRRAGVTSNAYGDMINGQNVAWRMVIMRPGDSPTDALASALSQQGKIDDQWEEGQRNMYTSIVGTTLRSSSMGLVKTVQEARLPPEAKILILVDQFEELFRFWSHREESSSGDKAKAFVRLLLNATRDSTVPIYIILTMRSEYLGDCMVFPGLPEAISESQYLVPRMSRNELLSSITGPLAASNEKITPRLASRLLNELGEDQDQLPILQHFLMRQWDRWIENRQDKSPLDFQHVDKEVSIQEALGRHADQIYDKLKKENKHNITKKVFKILTETNTEGLGIRRPVNLQLLCDITGESEKDIIVVIKHFRASGCSFLMPPAGTELTKDTIIDLSHESLMRTWGKLKEWIKEEERSARYYKRYLDVAKGWAKEQNVDNKKEYLWAGIKDIRLDFALNWQKDYRPSAAWAALYTSDRDIRRAQKNFVCVSNFIHESRQGREQKQEEIKSKHNKKVFNWSVLGVCILIFFSYLVLDHLDESKQIRKKKIDKIRAQKQQLNEAKLFSAKQERDPLLQALILSDIYSENSLEITDADDLLREVSTEFLPQEVYYHSDEAGRIEKITINPFGSKVAFGTGTGEVYLWDMMSSASAVEQKKADSNDSVTGLEFTLDGEGLLGTWSDGTIGLWNLKEDIFYVEHRNTPIRSLAVSPDTGKIAYGLFVANKSKGDMVSHNGKIGIFDISNGIPPLQKLKGSELSFDSPILSLSFGEDTIVSGALNGGGNLLTFSKRGGSIINNKKMFTLPERNSSAPYMSLARSENDVIAIGSEDGLIYLLASPNNETDPCISPDSFDACPFGVPGYNCIVLKPKKNYGDVVGVGFWNDRPFGGYEDGTVRFWQCDQSYQEYTQIMVLKGHKDSITDLALNHDTMISTDSADVRVWNLKQHIRNKIATLETTINGLAIGPKGDVISVGEDGHLWIIGQDGIKKKSDISESAVLSVHVSRNGKQVVTGAKDGSVAVWNLESIELPVQEETFDQKVSTVMFHAKDNSVYFGTGNNLMVWVPGTDPVFFYQSSDNSRVISLAFNEEETMLVAGFDNGLVKLWNNLDRATSTILGNHSSFNVRSISFLGNNHVVSSGDDGQVCLWDITKEEQRCETIAIFEGPALSVDVGRSVKGNMMVAGGGADGEILLIPNIKNTEVPVVKVGKVMSAVSNVRFSHDSKHIISTSEEGLVQKWPLTRQDLLAKLKKTTNVCLSVSQRMEYFQENEDKAENNAVLCNEGRKK